MYIYVYIYKQNMYNLGIEKHSSDEQGNSAGDDSSLRQKSFYQADKKRVRNQRRYRRKCLHVYMYICMCVSIQVCMYDVCVCVYVCI